MAERRSMLMEEDDEMPKWVKLVDFDGDVDVTGSFECPCLDTSGMTEFRIFIHVAPDSGSRYTSTTNAEFSFDGRAIGYYLFSKNWSVLGASVCGIAESYPIPFINFVDTGTSSVHWNRGNATMQKFFGETSNGSKKFSIGFPKGYTGHIIAEIYGR